MEWVIVNPSSLHEVCGLLGYISSTGDYHVKKESCGGALDEILTNLIADGPSLRTLRSLGLSRVISKDLVPLLTIASADHPKVVPKLIKLLAYLTSPIECIVAAEFAMTDEGHQVVFEVEGLLRGIKAEFSEFKVTKPVVDYLKHVTSQVKTLTPEECNGVSDGLLLLRNILHIPHKEPGTQHQILWNLFAHSIDKILLHLMTCEQKNLWGIPLVQLIALIYKDQHVANLQKLLNLWLENSTSESSEDNESNTSPNSSSSMLTSEPTSDSSDNGAMISNSVSNLRESYNSINSPLNITEYLPSDSSTPQPKNSNRSFMSPMGIKDKDHKDAGQATTQKIYTKAKSKNKSKGTKEKMSDVDSGVSSSHFSADKTNSTGEELDSPTRSTRGCISIEQISYNTLEGNSTSSNDDDGKLSKSIGLVAKQRPIKVNSHAVKLVPQLKSAPLLMMSVQDKREMKRKKLHKRSKRTKTSIKALVHHNPTEADISYVLREFTVDFLLKGYGSLVAVLQEQLSLNSSLQMDKSHFLWLITYFLKFASQMELDLEHISPVLSLKILSYLTYEGVAMCENLQVCKDDLKPHLRRMHLVVTALREFVQAVEIYSKVPSYSRADKLHINILQNQMLEMEELRNLLLLLIRYFKPGVQSKQYLQDLVITNHVFLLLLEKISCSEDYKGDFKMFDFVKEFSSPIIMQQYGHLLEDFKENGEFVNDCVFTMMHHIAGDLGCPEALCQPSILKTFSNIWEVEFEIKDDWADLIEYVIQKFMTASNEEKKQIFKSGTSNVSDDFGWTKEDFNDLYWYYTKCSSSSDPIAKILEFYGDGDAASGKTRESILNQLLHQKIIGYNQFLRFLASERVEKRGSNELANGDSSSSSSSHATAGSSCHSLPDSNLVDDGYSNEPFSYAQNGNIMKENESFIKHLSINEVTRNLAYKNSSNNNYELSTESSLNFEKESHKFSEITDSSNGDKEVRKMDIVPHDIIHQILNEGHDLSWIKNQILEACYVKFLMEIKQERVKRLAKASQELDLNDIINYDQPDLEFNNVGPVPYHYSLLGQSIPIIPWTQWQESLLMSPSYLLLLHKLGFHLPGDVGKLFPRIPHFWTAEVLLSVAKTLGPLPEINKMKFDPSDITNLMETNVNEKQESSLNSRDICISGVNSLGIACSKEPTFNMSTMGADGISPHTSYGFGSASHSVNWMTLVHKSKQLIARHSEPVKNVLISS